MTGKKPTRAKVPRTIPTRAQVATALMIAATSQTADAKDAETGPVGTITFVAPPEVLAQASGARVLIDGKPRPFNRRIRIAVGTHRLKILCTRANIERPIEVRKGAHTDIVYADECVPILPPPAPDPIPGGVPPHPDRDSAARAGSPRPWYEPPRICAQSDEA